MLQERAIALLSGGLDSAVSFYKALKVYEVVLALTFNYGQRSAFREIQAASKLCEKVKVDHRVIVLPWLKELTSTALVNRNQDLPQLQISNLDDPTLTQASAKAVWVSNRNGLFLNIAACYAEQLRVPILLTGFNREEALTFPDNSKEFVHALNQSLFYSTQVKCRVESLTLEMSKEEILREALGLEIPLQDLWSCYEGGEKMCGRCESCLRSKRAYLVNGLEDWVGKIFLIG